MLFPPCEAIANEQVSRIGSPKGKESVELAYLGQFPVKAEELDPSGQAPPLSPRLGRGPAPDQCRFCLHERPLPCPCHLGALPDFAGLGRSRLLDQEGDNGAGVEESFHQ